MRRSLSVDLRSDRLTKEIVAWPASARSAAGAVEGARRQGERQPRERFNAQEASTAALAGPRDLGYRPDRRGRQRHVRPRNQQPRGEEDRQQADQEEGAWPPREAREVGRQRD